MKKIPDTSINDIEIPENVVYKQTLAHYVDGQLKHTYYFYYDEHDNMVLMIKPPYKPFRYFYEYNNSGQVTVMSRNDGYQFSYEYNMDKTLSKEICYDKSELFYTTVYSYSDNNKRYKYTVYSSNSKDYCEFIYDNNGRLSIERNSDEKQLLQTKYFTYDDSGNLIKKEVDEKCRSIIYHEIYTYNSENRLIQTARYDNNKLSYTDNYTYEFYK